MKKIFGYVTPFYFGFILAVFGIDWTNWRFYVITIPVIIGYQLDKYYYPTK